jgi:hypothetical protein
MRGLTTSNVTKRLTETHYRFEYYIAAELQSASGFEQRDKLAAPVELLHFVVSANVLPADEHIRHSTLARQELARRQGQFSDMSHTGNRLTQRFAMLHRRLEYRARPKCI